MRVIKKIIDGRVHYKDWKTFSFFPEEEFGPDKLYRIIPEEPLAPKPKRKRKTKEPKEVTDD